MSSSRQIATRRDDALELIEHLRAMGETNALLQRNNILKKETALTTAAVYQSMFGAEDGTVPATFQLASQDGICPYHVELEAANFLQNLAQEPKDEAAKLAAKLLVV